MNTVQICGYLCSKPEERQTKTGIMVTNLSIADNLNKEEVIFWRVSVFGDTSKNIIKHLKTGSAVIVDGSMQPPRLYQKKDGTQGIGMSLTAHSVRFSPFKAKASDNEQPQSNSHQQNQGYGGGQNTQQPQQGNQYAQNNNSQYNQGQNQGNIQSGYEQADLPF